MRPQRFCLTIRGMMLAVAILGLLMGAATWLAEMRSRSASYRRKAFAYGDMAGTSMGKTVRARFGDKRVKASENENDWLRLAWATKLAEKYWRLADRPWLPVEPDPPPPERLDHPRMAVDMPADAPHWHWYRERVFPWWTFPWTWGTVPGQRYSGGSPRQGAWTN